jgi:hypothetical protein
MGSTLVLALMPPCSRATASRLPPAQHHRRGTGQRRQRRGHGHQSAGRHKDRHRDGHPGGHARRRGAFGGAHRVGEAQAQARGRPRESCPDSSGVRRERTCRRQQVQGNDAQDHRRCVTEAVLFGASRPGLKGSTGGDHWPTRYQAGPGQRCVWTGDAAKFPAAVRTSVPTNERKPSRGRRGRCSSMTRGSAGGSTPGTRGDV